MTRTREWCDTLYSLAQYGFKAYGVCEWQAVALQARLLYYKDAPWRPARRYSCLSASLLPRASHSQYDARARHTVAQARRGDATPRALRTVAGARRGEARARHTVAGARRAEARARRAVAETRRGDARARRAEVRARRADARARRSVAQARRAEHSSCARPSPQSAAGAGEPASRSASRTGARPTAAARRRAHRRCRSVDHRPSRRRRGGRGTRAGRGLASAPWRPIVRDLRDSHGCGPPRVAPGPSRHGGRGRGFSCDSADDTSVDLILQQPHPERGGSKVTPVAMVSWGERVLLPYKRDELN